MRLFEIRDDNYPGLILGYLFYYEKSKKFYIELPENADEWKTPLILSSLVKRGIYEADAEISLLWVQQRIVPTDRQNLGMILREHHLKEYDEFKLLMLAKGRCEQDDCYLEEISPAMLPAEIAARNTQAIRNVGWLSDADILVSFRNDRVMRCRLEAYAARLNRGNVGISPGGRYLNNGIDDVLSAGWLYQNGEPVGISGSELEMIARDMLVSTVEAKDMLSCTRQNIDDMVKKDKLHPVDMISKSKMFRRSEIYEQMW